MTLFTMAHRYGIELKAATSAAHWSLGRVERQHTKLRTFCEMLLEVHGSMTLRKCVGLAHMEKKHFPISKLGYRPHHR